MSVIFPCFLVEKCRGGRGFKCVIAEELTASRAYNCCNKKAGPPIMALLFGLINIATAGLAGDGSVYNPPAVGLLPIVSTNHVLYIFMSCIFSFFFFFF